MTRSELIQRIVLHRPHLTERDVRVAVTMLLEQMTACLADGGRIEIRGLGSFSLRFRAARIGRHPMTGAPVSHPARHVPHFKPGKRLLERVNRKDGGPR